MKSKDMLGVIVMELSVFMSGFLFPECLRCVDAKVSKVLMPLHPQRHIVFFRQSMMREVAW